MESKQSTVTYAGPQAYATIGKRAEMWAVPVQRAG